MNTIYFERKGTFNSHLFISFVDQRVQVSYPNIYDIKIYKIYAYILSLNFFFQYRFWDNSFVISIFKMRLKYQVFTHSVR